ncbi:hypothetical protein HIV01_004230 [Lysobacter arenosi]|uniref:Uncharacterized protein n=1 Tax=Lysobacter arenosi TaxID=2795387 RepID=A0ABX7REB5_9GAMM|nr:hypothetical protein [Lysobacter arenosi]QSX75739.1 hypothetical protein HIV01_004230 [Lysobacter arenosi]
MAANDNLIPKLGLGTVRAFFVYGAAFVPNGSTGGPVAMFGIAGAGLMYGAIVLTTLWSEAEAEAEAAKTRLRRGSRAFLHHLI